MNRRVISAKKMILAASLAIVLLLVPATALASTFPGINGRLLYTNTNSYDNYQMVTVKPSGVGSSAIGANDLARRYASFSPDGTKIVYTSGGSWQYTWIADADGTNAVQLTNGSTNSIYPSFSPDGTKILYSYAVSSIYQLRTMNLDGSGATTLYAPSGHVYKASYSPNGAKIVFSADFGGGDNEIGIINADGTGETNLTSNSQHDDDPSFSPDGTKIVYNSLALTGGSTYQIHTMNLDGSGDTQLTSASVYHGSPVYSPDGTKIAYRRGSSPSEVYYMNADGTGETRVTTNGWVDAKIDWQPLTLPPTKSTSSPSITLINGSGTLNVADLYTDHYNQGVNNASLTITSGPSSGSANINSSTGVVTYTQTTVSSRSFWSNFSSIFFPKVSAAATDSFSYRICSNASDSLCSTSTVSVLGLSSGSLSETGDGTQTISQIASWTLFVSATILLAHYIRSRRTS